MEAQNLRAAHFRSLHQPGNPLVLCNVYDAATARIVASNPSCQALATASYAIAYATGEKDDDSMSLETNIAAIRIISPVAAEFSKPLTVDLQDGYGSELPEAMRTIIHLGAVGCNIEDKNDQSGDLYPIGEATDRIRTALATATDAGVPSFAVNARTDTLTKGGSIDDAITRAKSYLAAGATTAYVWGGISRGDVQRLTKALDGQLNVRLILGEGYLTVSELRALGVARVSIGPDMYRAAMKAAEDYASRVYKS